MAKWVMVLNDGTTYTDLDGCAIVAVPDWVADEDFDEFIGGADGYYCFTDKPTELEPNNGMTLEDVKFADHARKYQKCGGCGMMFNLDSGFERIMAAQHNCNEQETQ